MTGPIDGGSTLGLESKKLGRSALVYLVPGLLVTGMSVLLTPLYARAMSPDEFAIVAIANSITALLGIVLGLALPSCVLRLFFEYEEVDRRRFYGTLLIASIAGPAVVVAALFALGARGGLDIFETVRFEPHLELILLTSLAAVFRPLVASVYMAREDAGKVGALSLFSALLQVAFTVLFVVLLAEGAVGVLRANLAAGAATALASIALMARAATLDLRLPGLGAALAFSLPLVPHLAANWALSVSDRLILDRYVPAVDIGRYSLAYMFSLLLGLIGMSIGNALGPMANRQLKDPARARNVPPLGTYALLAVVVCGVAFAAAAPEVIAVIAPPSYAPAAEMVPWVVLGAVFQGLYLIWSIGTWFSMRTRLVPFITVASAGVNVALNLLFVPLYGVMAAAVVTAVSYAVLAGLHGALAQRLYPIPWEYRRWIWIAAFAIVWYAAASAVPSGVAAKLLIAIVLFPASLVLTGFLTREEMANATAFASRRLRRA